MFLSLSSPEVGRLDIYSREKALPLGRLLHWQVSCPRERGAMQSKLLIARLRPISVDRSGRSNVAIELPVDRWQSVALRADELASSTLYREHAGVYEELCEKIAELPELPSEPEI